MYSLFKLIIILVIVIDSIYLYFFYFSTNYSSVIELKSDCKCRSNLKIKKINNVFTVDEESFEETFSFSCDLYKTLRRGKKQNIISYSLYGKNKRYYNLIKQIIKLSKNLYPNWIIRIYYDDSIDKNIICEIECQTDNTDFCNVNKLPVQNSFHLTWNASFILGSMWRFLPVGDSFVNAFMSRDLDSMIYEREIDSVNVWYNKSNKYGHIMRDHPEHRAPILAGMWGLYKSKNEYLSNKIYKFLVNKTNALYYKKLTDIKWSDQYFLAEKVYPLIRNISIIHDSYLCLFYKDSEPFPSKRKNKKYYIGYNNYYESMLTECPTQCRPKNHTDWIYC